jgi:hypothetical protein
MPINPTMRAALYCLLVVAVFDPVDQTHLKAPLFAAVWVLFLVDLATSRTGRYQAPVNLYLFVTIFVILLPAAGMLVYLVRGGSMADYEGFKYWKSYLFLTLSIPLVVKRIDVMRPLSLILTMLSVVTIVLYSLAMTNELIRAALAAFADTYVIFSVSDRTYGPFSYSSVYFHGTPLIVIALGYFCYQGLNSAGREKVWNLALLAINVCGMILSGTRNNMLAGFLTPLVILGWYRGVKTRIALGMLALLAVAAGFASGLFQEMLSPDEYSNATKLGHIHDYGIMFGDWKTVVFGQGLGASFFSTAWGTRVTLTEVTYLEVIRNYGLLLAPFLFLLILYPLRVLFDLEERKSHYLFLAYAAYLGICTGNPLLLSSSGMLVLAIVLVRTFGERGYAAVPPPGLLVSGNVAEASS